MVNLPPVLPPSVDKAVENLIGPPTKAAGDAVAALVLLVFAPIIYFNDKQQAKYRHNLEIYKQELSAKLAEIPEENIIEPKLQIAAQALEDSKYCIEEPDLREMFANLIASASDKTKASTVHPSFSTILKQMSPQDAAVIRRIKQGGDTNLPIAKLQYNVPNTDGYITLTKDILIPVPTDLSSLLASDSLSSLLAFGLISIDYNNFLSADTEYERFERFADVGGYKAKAEQANSKIEVQKGICTLTPYGHNFVLACIA